jgi:peptidoglycan/LPS O-acetylase OafA/YrhL
MAVTLSAPVVEAPPPLAPGTPRPAVSGAAKRRRLDHIDAMRPIKQVGVVSTHSLLAFAPLATLAAGASLVLLHVTREAFLFVSACMLTYSYRSLARRGLGRFWKRRFMAVGVPYLCWTLLYFFITLPKTDPASPGAALAHLGNLTVTGYYHLYYLLVIAQFYVVFPFLLWVVKRTERWHWALLAASLATQVALTALMHWRVLPTAMRGVEGAREITSYEFYLLAGMVVAFHLSDVHRWLVRHARLVLAATVAAAAFAETLYVLAARHTVPGLGDPADPFAPFVIPYNVTMIASLYLLGVFLVDDRRSARLRRWVRLGSDDAYGVYLNQMLFVLLLTAVGWRQLGGAVPWPLWSILAVVLIFLAGMALTEVIARTPLAKVLTGRERLDRQTAPVPLADPLHAGVAGD